MTYKQLKSKAYSSFEHCMVKVTLTNKKCITLLCVYRLLFVSVVVFLEEIAQLLGTIITSHECIILAGDVNIHTETEERYAKQFNDIMDMLNMVQHVKVPTHKMGHTLDIVATLNSNPLVKDIKAMEYDISHHFLVDFLVTCRPVQRQHKIISYRNTKAIESNKFTEDINDKLNKLPQGTFGEKMKYYNDIMAEVLNEHAPLKSKKVKIIPDAPWFDGEYDNLRKLRRKAERLYKKTGLLEHREHFIDLRKQTTALAYEKKRSYYDQKLKDMPNNKTLYSVVNELIDNKQEVVLPMADSDQELADSFMNYFSEKISKIRSKFSVNTIRNLNDTEYSGPSLSEFEKVTADELLQIILSFGIKCSPEDPHACKVVEIIYKYFPSVLVRISKYLTYRGKHGLFKECHYSAFNKGNGQVHR